MVPIQARAHGRLSARAGFDWLAPHYRWLEFVLAGDKLQRCRTAYLDQSRAAQRVLIVGEGNGRFLLACRRQWPSAQLTCLDASLGMLCSSRKRLLRHGVSLEAIEFIHADILSVALSENCFDLIVTNFFLDCFPPAQLEVVIGKLARAAAAQAKWWVADFCLPHSGPARWRAELIHRAMYWFFRLATQLPARALTPPDDLLARHGFCQRQRRTTEWGLLHADEWIRTP